MTEDEWRDFVDTIKANDRKHAGYFSWRTDRELEEFGVVQTFHESLCASGAEFFHSYRSRGAGNDPPDCEGLSNDGKAIGFEVTELVDGASIGAATKGHATNWQPPFSKEDLLELISDRVKRKDSPAEVKGGPYDQYVLIIYCDEPRVLHFELIQALQSATFPRARLIDRAFMLFSYSPFEQRCPYIELQWIDV